MRQFLAVVVLAVTASASAAIPADERQALVALYEATGGASWKDRTNWLGAAGSECTWYGVSCDEEQAHVIHLTLYDNNLRGQLPPDLRKLTSLISLQVWDNALTGSLPRELSELSSLAFFYAARNQLTGTIPAAFGALKKLAELSLDGNQLEGPLPRELGDMSAMRILGLSYNALTGPIPPELGKLASLTDLELSVNHLSGAIPKELGSLPKLENLGLTLNELTGAIPPELGNLPAIVELRLNYNQLTGGIPAALGRARTLEVLRVGDNTTLGGTLPPDLGDLPALRILEANTAGITGGIPPHYYDLATLEELQLGNNQLTGALSPELGRLTKLQVLGLSANDFTGAIPPAITTIAPLRSLELASNALSGPIPADIGRLADLYWLDLSGNALSGAIPPQLGSLANLNYLFLYENQLEGPLPPELGNLSSVVYFYLDNNRFTGPIPDALRKLANVEQLGLRGNQLTGPVPSWIGELSKLTGLLLGANRLTGTIPPAVSTLGGLVELDLSRNELTGPLPDFSSFHDLRFLSLHYNQLTGSIPASIGVLVNLESLELSDNALTGPLPREIANLTKLDYIDASRNSLDGPIPAEIGRLGEAYQIALTGNRLSGTIPPEIGDLNASLRNLYLGYNALRGPIPAAITKLTALPDGGSDFSYNALYTADPKVRDFVNAKQGYDVEDTQTVTPAGVRIVQVTDRSATLSWTPIRYQGDGGGYQVAASTTPGGAPVAIATTSTKELDSITLRNLAPATSYFFTVTAVTHPHDEQENLLVSEPSPVLEGASGGRVIAAPEVVISERPQGMVRIDDVEVVADQFTLTNFGDLATAVTLERVGDFFTVSPETFSLAGGASQVVSLRSRPNQPRNRDGNVIVRGQGVPEDTYVDVALLSAARPAGTVVAEPVKSTIELAGERDSVQVGTVQFRNRGTAELSGILVSDEPWVEPPTDPVRIEPGAVASINFRVNRARRRGPAEGALSANLSLIYVDGAAATLLARGPVTTDTPGVNVSKVTIIDTTKPPVISGAIPPLGAGQLPLFLPGMVAGTNLRSDVIMLNAAAGFPIGDLKLYFSQGGSTSIASPQALGASSGLSLVNIVGNVFGVGSGTGTIQVRTSNWQSLATDAKITNATAAGTFSGSVPVFRADRSIRTGERLYLVGVAMPGDLFVQETFGTAATARIEYLDAAGNSTGSPRTEPLGAYSLLQLTNAIPPNAATVVVSSVSGSLTAYARIRDAVSGDSWSVVDWSRLYDYQTNEAARIPFADGRTGGGGKRRSVRHDAVAPRGQTDVALFNPGTEETRVRMQVVDVSGAMVQEREVTVAPKATVVVTDVGAIAASTAHVLLVPTRGRFVATARSRRAANGGGTAGTAVPVLAAASGLRLGQSQIFANLDDSTTATVNAATPATFRTSYGLVETSGAPATVKAEIIIGAAYALVSIVTSRTFQLAPRQQLVLPELVRSFAGDNRDTLFGDLYGLSLSFEVTAGSGSVVPFVIATENGTGDSVLRIQ